MVCSSLLSFDDEVFTQQYFILRFHLREYEATALSV